MESGSSFPALFWSSFPTVPFTTTSAKGLRPFLPFMETFRVRPPGSTTWTVAVPARTCTRGTLQGGGAAILAKLHAQVCHEEYGIVFGNGFGHSSYSAQNHNGPFFLPRPRRPPFLAYDWRLFEGALVRQNALATGNK